MAASPAPDATTAALRRFNRFYTARIGALGGRFLDTPHTLTEARVLYELGERGPATAATLAQALEVDPAQISRTVARLLRGRLVSRARDPEDGRAHRLSLTAGGRREFQRLDARSAERAETLVSSLSASDRARLQDALRTVEALVSGQAPSRAVLIRPHRPGDFGWIISRHGALYAEEYGWDGSFEAFVAGVAKEILERFDPRVEGCWIAEVDGRTAGSVCLVRKSAAVAKLRLLIVDPAARGLGVGQRLVDECVAFARRAGYRKVTLWTNDILDAARHIYEKAGFERVAVSAPETAFGKTQIFETWELGLEPRRR
ncbi:MAG: bifunctional helix-turn-helix transcriptional regulator/GNAT family N-acetyltransferase [Vicinamibacterales bacterium]